MNINIVFFGASKHVIPLLDVLKENHTLSLIITTESLPTEPVSTYAKTHTIPLLTIKQCSNITIEEIKKTNAPIGILAYFGIILPPTVLNLFPKGILNVHPSLLPLYRGSTPVQTAILNGDKTTGVTFIKLDEQTDHGPIISQISEPIHEDDTAETLYQRLFKRGAKILKKDLPPYLEDKVKLKVQDDAKATFTQDFTRHSGYFDSNNPPSPQQLDRMIRAYHPWPGAWTRITMNDERRTVNKIIKFLPASSHPELLPVDRQGDSGSLKFVLQMEGKKPISFKDFINGYPQLAEIIKSIIQ